MSSHKINFDLEDLTNAALKRMVKQLLAASDGEEKKVLSKLSKPPKNDLADLHEEMHGKPNTPDVEPDDEVAEGEELPNLPKKGKKNA
jgi:hypothetical protein